MSFFKDFRTFAVKGNVIDMAVGVIIGQAFGKIVSSLVSDIITPLIGVLLGKIDIKNWTVGFDTVTINIGAFCQNILDFLIIAFSIFCFIRIIENLKNRYMPVEEPKVEKAPAAPSDSDLLKSINENLQKIASRLPETKSANAPDNNN